MRSSLALAVLTLVYETTGASASLLWPFREKRFKAEKLIDAGPLGLEGVQGRVVALGDWNGDQHSDLFVLSADSKSIEIFLWHRASFQFKLSHTLSLDSPITNVVPGDYDHDGRLDLLVMSERKEGGWWGGESKLGMGVYLGAEGGGFEQNWDLPPSTPVQGLIFDADGSMRPSILAYPNEEGSSSASSAGGGVKPDLKVWRNNGTGFELYTAPFQNAGQACTLGDTHSSAFVDIDGDCVPDLVLHCSEPRSTRQSIQIWLNRGPAGYTLGKSYDLPKGVGPLSFADMDRDGTIDIIFPVCGRHSTSSGLGSDCTINIAYNKQIPTCSSEASQLDKGGRMKCRGHGDMCRSDEDFEFSFQAGSQSFKTIPLSSIFPASSDTQLLLHAPGQPNIPFPLRPGDYNIDGFPDLLLTVYNDSVSSSTVEMLPASRRGGRQVKILENIPCKAGLAACDTAIGRTFRVGRGAGWEDLEAITDAEGASWIDIDDDGSLDIMVQRTGAQGGGKVSFVQNNFYHDAFFLKAQVLNGACKGLCEPADGRKKYSGLGASYSGASYKFTVLDTLGKRVAQQVTQLPQSGYHALGTPYSYIGLGRTNNYIEKLFVGASLHPPKQLNILESLIPNSQLIIIPPFPLALGSDTNETLSPGRGQGDRIKLQSRPVEWSSQLYLHPGDWIPTVAAAVFGTVIILAFVVFGLHRKEKREDEKERRRALHAINFQAL